MTMMVTPLKQIMVAEGRRQSWLAAEIGKDQAEVSRITKGLIPDEETQEAIAKALRRSVEELWPDPESERTAA